MNSNFERDLNQIRIAQEKVYEVIDQIKENANGWESVDLFQIQLGAKKLLDEIDEIRKRCDDSDQALTELPDTGDANHQG